MRAWNKKTRTDSEVVGICNLNYCFWPKGTQIIRKILNSSFIWTNSLVCFTLTRLLAINEKIHFIADMIWSPSLSVSTCLTWLQIHWEDMKIAGLGDDSTVRINGRHRFGIQVIDFSNQDRYDIYLLRQIGPPYFAALLCSNQWTFSSF